MSTDHLHIDFETRSELDITVCGLHNYAVHPSTEIVLMAYAFGDKQVKVWSPRKEPMPGEVQDLLLDPWVIKSAWNSSFERALLKGVLKMDIPASEFVDPMVGARYLSMPGYLEDVGAILKLDQSEAKMKEGSKLIQLFCGAAITGGEQSLFGVTETAYFDWNTHPNEWKLFEEYVKLDVVSERAIAKKIAKFPLPDSEYEGWLLDQRINERGLFCNLPLCRGAKFIADKSAKELKLKLKELTGLSNPNSNEQMVGWLKDQGYPFPSLGKPFVNRAMDGEGELTEVAREVLEIRRMTSKTSVNKFDAILEGVCSDGRLRHQFSFLGAQRTGRWSGRSSTGTGVQLQNLAKANKKVEEQLALAIQLVQQMDFDEIVRVFGHPLEVASSVIRAAFEAEEGHILLICDLAAIEARVSAWLARCQPMLDVFATGRDIYKDFATRLFSKPYEEITKAERNYAKPGILGACYQLGAGEEIITPEGVRMKTGLLGYAAMLGVEFTQEQSTEAIRVYRTEYKEIVNFWYDLERAAISVVKNGGTETVGFITFDCVSLLRGEYKVLRAQLPSGRHLHYIDPQIEESEFTANGKTFKKDVVTYMGVDQQTRQWVRQHTRGGHLTENFCQAVARDVLLSGLMLAETNGMPVVAHVHDEIICEVPDDGSKTVAMLEDCMKAVPVWAEGLPLDAAGFSSKFYKKE